MSPDNRHRHVVIRAEVAKPPIGKTRLDRLTNRHCAFVCSWMKELIGNIGMKIMFGPRAMYCANPGNRGLTAFAIIETSHVVMHTWDECVPGIVQLDVYTCSDLDLTVVFDALDVFEPSKIEWKFLDREGSLTLQAEGATTRSFQEVPQRSTRFWGGWAARGTKVSMPSSDVFRDPTLSSGQPAANDKELSIIPQEETAA